VRYQVESRTAVFSAGDTTTAIDSVTVSATATLRMRRGSRDRVELEGTVQSLTVSSGLGARRSMQTLQGPFTLSWSVTPDSASLVPVDTTSCDQLQETARDVLLSLFPPLPATVTGNQTWRGVTALRSCRGGVALSLTTSTNHAIGMIADARRTRELQVNVDGSTTISGSGTQGASTVNLRGRGNLESAYFLDLSDGAVRSATSRIVAQVEFDLGYRTENLVQRTTRSISRADSRR
jgi:hypothetical protein